MTIAGLLPLGISQFTNFCLPSSFHVLAGCRIQSLQPVPKCSAHLNFWKPFWLSFQVWICFSHNASRISSKRLSSHLQAFNKNYSFGRYLLKLERNGQSALFCDITFSHSSLSQAIHKISKLSNSWTGRMTRRDEKPFFSKMRVGARC